MEQLHGPSYYYDEKSGAKQSHKPTARVPDEEPVPDYDGETDPALYNHHYHERRRDKKPQFYKPTARVPDEEPAPDYDFQRAHEEYLRRKYPWEHWAGNPY